MCRLLPNEKPRQKKDFGTTSYKKPGPPTPSKNGGRLSLQGNEVQPLREQNQRTTITPKKVTPSRIRALFMGRTNVSRENNEVHVDYLFDVIHQFHMLTPENFRPTGSRFSSEYLINSLHVSSASVSTVEKIFYLQALLFNKIRIYARNFLAYCFLLLWRSENISACSHKNVSKTV